MWVCSPTAPACVGVGTVSVCSALHYITYKVLLEGPGDKWAVAAVEWAWLEVANSAMGGSGFQGQ